ncbi:hypothetical protein WICPIJ_005628 [Wickerhamomyces pijperi]|uniref:ADP-ribose 1''-phosphate phosphatase n=1 Tax=Wickerhamomyces pijperi TaxID=599730 RepID=A0A9P8Q5T6_WICPI|nr:hypothetical protein WICPIJ_005628 [Wickerhamomyces pijperi]
MSIKYLKGDLLTQITTYPSYILHSCNCQGSWGGGFAYQLSKRYPQATKIYQDHCRSFKGKDLVGKSTVIPSDDGKFQIICLFTSYGSGGTHDDPDTIVNNTRSALKDLRGKVPQGALISMPLINSGIFMVPWADTEDVLKMYEDLWSFDVYVL